METLLANIPIFAGLSDDQKTGLIGVLQRRQIAPNETICWIGDRGTEFYIIHTGHVALSYPDESGQEIKLADLGPGQFFGELSLLDGGRRTATARTIEQTELFVLDRSQFHDFLMKNPAATLLIINVLGRRHRNMLDQLRGVVNENEVFKEKQTTWTRVSQMVTTFSASAWFVLCHIIFVIAWIMLNGLRGRATFDPYPFNLLGLVCGLEAILLSIFVLVSQNRQSEKDRVRADLDYQVNRKAHMEVMQLHQKIDQLTEMIRKHQEEKK